MSNEPEWARRNFFCVYVFYKNPLGELLEDWEWVGAQIMYISMSSDQHFMGCLDSAKNLLKYT